MGWYDPRLLNSVIMMFDMASGLTAEATLIVSIRFSLPKMSSKFLILLNSTTNTMIEDGEVCQQASLGQIIIYLQRDIVK